MAELGFWVRGARAPQAESGPAQLTFDATGALRTLKQNGWTVSYERYANNANGDARPSKLKAIKLDAQVKVIVQSWR